MPENKVTCTKNYYHLKIFIDGVVHLHFNINNFDGYQSWLLGIGQTHHTYYIEFYRKQGDPIIADYDQRVIWEDVLKALNDNL